jgi:hypothetical protein
MSLNGPQSGAPSQAAFNEASVRFNTFLANTDQKLRTREAIHIGLAEYAPDVLENLASPVYPFTVLYVGAGNGGLEIPLTGELIEQRGTASKVKVFCEDPSAEMAKQFQARISNPNQSHPESLFTPDILRGYAVTPFENPDYDPPLTDISIASHVWYYVGGWRDASAPENSLAKFANTVLEFEAIRGVGLITLQSVASDRHNLRSLFLKLTESAETELAGEEVGAVADELALSTRVSTIESHTNVASCFQDGIFNPTPEGKHLLSFILRDSWDTLSPDTQRPIAERLTEMTDNNGGRHMRFIDTALWIG